MTIHSVLAYGTSTTAGTAVAHYRLGMLAYGTSTTTGYAYAYVIKDLLVTQAAGQVDGWGEILDVTQAGANVDLTHNESRRVTQVAANVEETHDEARRVTQIAADMDAKSADGILRATQVMVMVDVRKRREILTSKLVEYHVYDRYDNYLEYFDNAYERAYLAELNGTGSGSFKLPANDAKATAANLKTGNIVKVRYCNTNVGAFLIEHVDKPLISEAEGARSFLIRGRGLLATLAKGVIYPTDIGDSSTVTRSYTAAACGSVFLDLYGEFETRGGGDLGTDFSTTLDSGGASWTDTQTEDYSAGQTMLDVVRHHVALGIEVTVTPDKVLHYWVEAGSDKTSTVQFATGKNIIKCNLRIDGRDLTNVVLGEGQDMLVETTDATSVSEYGRRETYLSGRNTGESSQITTASNEVLDEVANPVDAIDMTVACDVLRPFIDYELGDTVRVHVPDEIDQQDYRVRSIAITDAGGPEDIIATLAVNSVQLEYMTKLHRSVELARRVPVNASAGISASQGDTRLISYVGNEDAVKLQGRPISADAPSAGEVLGYDGSQWKPATSVTINQATTDAAIPVLELEQADISEGLINFVGSDRGTITGATDSVSSIRVELGGTIMRLAMYADA